MSAIDTLMQRNAVFAERRFTPNLPITASLGITVIVVPASPRDDAGRTAGETPVPRAGADTCH